MKTDRKIDMLHRMALIGSPVKSPSKIRVLDETEDEEDEEEDEEEEVKKSLAVGVIVLRVEPV